MPLDPQILLWFVVPAFGVGTGVAVAHSRRKRVGHNRSTKGRRTVTWSMPSKASQERLDKEYSKDGEK